MPNARDIQTRPSCFERLNREIRLANRCNELANAVIGSRTNRIRHKGARQNDKRAPVNPAGPGRLNLTARISCALPVRGEGRRGRITRAPRSPPQRGTGNFSSEIRSAVPSLAGDKRKAINSSGRRRRKKTEDPAKEGELSAVGRGAKTGETPLLV